jgi:hypothetical protein
MSQAQDVKFDRIAADLQAIVVGEKTEGESKGVRRNLYFSYYIDRNAHRQEELDLCLQLNLLNPSFNHVFIFDESGTLKSGNHVTVIPTHNRLTFNDFFRFANICSGSETLNVLINTDIVLGEGFSQLTLESGQAICLSRYEVGRDGSYSIRVGGGSHDCWIWRGQMNRDVGQFYMGKFLCDGVLAGQLVAAGYRLKNPVYGLKIYHLHLSEVRNYGNHDLIRGRRNGVRFSNNDGVFKGEDIYDDGCNR